MTRGVPDVNIGVIHPIESYWLMWGPNSQTKQKRKRLQENFENIINWLLFSNFDFDFISESMVPELHEGSEGNYTQIGNMKYEVLIVPELITIRERTISLLKGHMEKGGKVIFLGNLPKIIDGDCNKKFNYSCFNQHVINNSKYDLLDALELYRRVDIINVDKSRNENYLYQLRMKVSVNGCLLPR